MLPSSRWAASRAAAGAMPRRTFSAVSRSRWYWNSSSSSRSTRRWRKSERSRSGMRRIQRSSVMSHLLEPDDRRDGRGETVPVVRFELELLSPGARERVELGAAVVFAWPPFGGDPPFLLELVQGGVERAVADLKRVFRDLLEPVTDVPPVHRIQGEHLEDEQIERSLNEVLWSTHGSLSRRW